MLPLSLLLLLLQSSSYSTSMLLVQLQPASPWRCRCLLWTVAHVSFSAAGSCSRSPGHHHPWTMKYYGPFCCYEVTRTSSSFSGSSSALRRVLLPAQSLFPHLSTVHTESQVYILVSLVNFHSRTGLGQYLPSPYNLALVGHPCITYPPHIIQLPPCIQRQTGMCKLVGGQLTAFYNTLQTTAKQCYKQPLDGHVIRPPNTLSLAVT